MPCDGSCCVCFPIGGGGATIDYVRNGRVRDGDLLGFMLRALTHEEALEHRARFDVHLTPDPAITYYRCIYWDETTRLCGAYENRPEMCSDYPYPWTPGNGRDPGCNTDGVCEHGCDCKGAPLLWDGD